MHWVFYLIAAIAVIILVYSESVAHDCIPHKKCNHSVPNPSPEDDFLTRLDKIMNMVENNHSYVSWRQALIVGIIAPVPIIYYLKGKLPEFFEWVMVGVIIFAGYYFSASWVFYHFYLPNGNQINTNLAIIRDRIQDQDKLSSTNCDD